MEIRKPTVPIDVQGAINYLNASVEPKEDMLANEDIPKGNYFIKRNVVYCAIRAIPKGCEIKPNVNCVAKSLNDVIGGK